MVYSKDLTAYSINNTDEFDFLINSCKIDLKMAKKFIKRTPSYN